MDRERFLTEVWQSYPAAPRGGAWRFGRFERQGRDFVLKRAGAEEKFTLPEAVELHGLREGAALAAAAFWSVLRTGDWVGYRAPEGDGKAAVILLAPQRRADPRDGAGGRADAPGFARPLTPTMRAFADYRADLRAFFRGRGFEEIATPTLVDCPGTEIFLDVFRTEFAPGTPRARELYLPTSPELHLKKALALGAERIFELRPCFRNGEIGEKHRPEFWMLEWYRAFADLEDLKGDCRDLVRHVAGLPELQFSEVSVRDLFGQLGIDLTPRTTAEELKAWCRRLGLAADHYELWDDLFYLIFVDRIEPFLPSAQPLFVTDYPPSQAALARVNERGWADRFELYWRGLEIANAYFELNDPVEQRRRSAEDLRRRAELGRQPLRLDEGFFAALESGMPPSAGIALGAERLFMAARGVKDIGELSPFG